MWSEALYVATPEIWKNVTQNTKIIYDWCEREQTENKINPIIIINFIRFRRIKYPTFGKEIFKNIFKIFCLNNCLFK